MERIEKIMGNLDRLHQELIYIRDRISRERFSLSDRDKEEIYHKHVELATCFGLLEDTIRKVTVFR
jgi:hypothetical protein